MPVSYRIDTAARVVFSKVEGRVTDDECLAHQNRLRADPAFDRSFDYIYDMSEVTEADVSEDTIRLLTERNPFLPSVRRAIVAKTEQTGELARMFLAHTKADPNEVRVYASVEEARRSLYLPKD